MTLAGFEEKFSVLDLLPESIYSTIVTHHHGDLTTRCHGILQWREALLAGGLPEEADLIWPAPALARTILMRMETLELAEICYRQDAITDSILKDICEGVTSAEEYFSQKGDIFVDKLAQRQKIRDSNSSFKDEEGLADHVDTSESGQGESDTDRDHDNANGYASEPSAVTSSTQAGQADSKGEPAAQPYSQRSPLTESPAPKYTPQSSSLEQTNANDLELQMAEPISAKSVVADTPATQKPVDTDNNSELSHENDTEEPDSNHHVDSVEIAVHSISPSSPPSLTTTEVGQFADIELEDLWQTLAGNWKNLSDAYKQFSGFLGTGWDLTPGQLQSQGWQSLMQYQQKLSEMPELKKLVAELGRHRGPGEVSQQREQQHGPKTTHEVFTPLAMMEAGGIVRGDSLSRMLPAESLLLGHPRLKMLWHAKRAEQLLLSYQYSGLMADQTKEKPRYQSSDLATNNQLVAGGGPIIICLDTSASMRGQPEQITKALTLETIRIARAEKRACHLYSFGSSDEIIEHSLDSNAESLSELLEFLQQSFCGGTNVCQPLLTALKKQQQSRWKNSDILLVSDGHFPVQYELFEKVSQLKKERGLRIHGVLLGNWRGRAMEALCEPMHRVSNWQTSVPFAFQGS